MDLELNTYAERQAEEAQKHDAFSAINLRHIRGAVAEALTSFGRLGLLEEYTKHDISHIDAMLEMYDWIIPTPTKSLMTPADWLLVTITTYLHDFGLLVTRDEFERRNACDSYAAFARRVTQSDEPSTMDYRSQIAKMDHEEKERFLYQEFVRSNHAQRIRAWLQETPDLSWGGDPRITEALNTLLGSLEETFLEDVGLVCESHHLDDINDSRKYPVSRPYGRTHQEEANVQYAAFLLRTSDLLHITKDRVPSMAAVVINPRNPKSQVEWAKQRAVRSVRPLQPARSTEGEGAPIDTIEVHATFKEAEGYFGLTAYLQYASRQLSQTHSWSNDSLATGTTNYVFPWRRIDMSHIEAKGFIAEPFEFSIDQGKILDLLTGHTLYNDTGVVIRELVQNSLDAVRLQAQLSDSSYTPRIDIQWNSTDKALCITDNGVGMTQSTIERNFLKVGASRYQEADFRKQHPDFTPISRFGIGVLSTFMVADDVSVSTTHQSEPQARQLSLRDVHGQYLVRLVDKHAEGIPPQMCDHGTSVRIKLRPSAELEAVRDIVRHWILVPGCELWLTVDDGEPEKVGFDSVSQALTQALIDGGLAHQGDTGLIDAYGRPVEVRSYTADGIELSYAVSWSRWLQEWQFLKVERDPEERAESEAPVLGVSIGGIRVTTAPAGFRVGGLAAMANATGKGSPRTNVARSAIEKTDEYDQMLRQIYSGYVDHIAKEMHAMSSERGASLTRAATEASFLAEDVAQWPADSNEIRRSVLRTIPALVIEENGHRHVHSLSELEKRDELASIESTTLSSLENVLWSIRDSGDATLAGLLDALGRDESLPEVPIMCGLGRAGFLGQTFASEWEVSRIEGADGLRTLRTTWKRRSSPARWRRPATYSEVPQNLIRHARDMSWGLMRVIDAVRLAATDDIDVVNISGSLVACHGQVLVLPGSAFLAIEPANPDVPERLKDWCTGYILALTSGQFAAARRGLHNRRPEIESAGRDKWITTLIKDLDDFGFSELLSLESVANALTATDLEVLDVMRWDQRRESE